MYIIITIIIIIITKIIVKTQVSSKHKIRMYS